MVAIVKDMASIPAGLNYIELHLYKLSTVRSSGFVNVDPAGDPIYPGETGNCLSQWMPLEEAFAKARRWAELNKIHYILVVDPEGIFSITT